MFWDVGSGWGDATCTPDKSRGSYTKSWGHTRYHTVKAVCCGGHTNCPYRPFARWATHFSMITMQLFEENNNTINAEKKKTKITLWIFWGGSWPPNENYVITTSILFYGTSDSTNSNYQTTCTPEQREYMHFFKCSRYSFSQSNPPPSSLPLV
jgi:hypothetical protein